MTQRPMSTHFDKVINIALLCSVAFLIYGQVKRPSGREAARKVIPIADTLWKAMTRELPVVGGSSRALKVVVFTDVQCPFCAEFQATLRELAKRSNGGVVEYLIHLPLPQHPMAKEGATAIECAKASGNASDVYDALLLRQSTLRKDSLLSQLQQSGIPIHAGFERCFRDGVPTVLERHAEFARALGVSATPTVVIDGQMWQAPPSLQELLRLAARK